VRDELLRISPRSVLDVGCGDGFFLSQIEEGVKRAVGVDRSTRALRFARAFCNKAHFVCGEAGVLAEKFDVVSAIEVLEHIPGEEVTPFIGSLAERVAAGGFLFICVPTVVQPINRKHYRHYTNDLLIEQVKAARIPFSLYKLDYLSARSRLYEWLLRALVNRFWAIEVRGLQSLLWKYAISRLQYTEAPRGRHLLGIFKKEVA
jgi:2-polyprenyl-3-methyl-5-hydroxy-6-metoxy-1,4-benzoquinol methylase